MLAACNVLFEIPSLSNIAFKKKSDNGLTFPTAFYVMQNQIAASWPLRCYLSGSSEFHRTASLKLLLTCTA